MLVHKVTLKKKVQKHIKLKKLESPLFLKLFFGHIKQCCQKSKTIFSKQFYLNYLILFYIESSKLSRNIYKLRVKLRKATIYPPWGPPFKSYFFQKLSPTPSEMLDLLRRWHLQDIDEKNHGLFNQGLYKSQFYMAKWTIM